MNHRSSILMRVGSFVLLLSVLLKPQSSAAALTTLTVTPITWNVIGLDSNNVNVGPNHFPIAVRVCNSGTESATNVTAVYNWDSSNTHINIRPSTLSTVNLGTLAPNACADAYFEVEVTRNSSAYDTTRDYHISVTAGNVTGTVNTPVRQLYVEHLVSQNRNATTNVEYGTSLGSMTSVPAGGTMNLMVGNTYYIRLTGFTATQGYEQLETFLNIPNTIFQTLSVSTTYTADSSATVSSPNDKLYGDACTWESNQSDSDYRSCLSTGKVGGNITVTYQVKILQVPSSPLLNPQPLSSLIYDFSGSSYHYNADYSVSTRYANIINASIEKSFSPKTITPGSNSTLTFTINNPGTETLTNVNFTDDLPNNVTLANSSVSYSSCGSPSPTSGSLTDPLTFTNITVNGLSTCTITVTVTSNTNGSYSNTTSTLKVGSTDTLDTASDTLVVSSAPPPPNSCTTRTTMATWNFENYSALAGNTITVGDSGPFDASSDVLINTPTGTYVSQGSSASAIIDRDLAVPTNWTIPSTGNTTTVWGIRDAWPSAAPADITNPTSPFFQFQVNTDGLYGGVGISLDYNLITSGGWSNSGPWYILFSTNGTTWSNLSPSTPPVGIDGTWDKGSWVPTSDVDTINANSTSTSSTVYFRLYFVGANNSQIVDAHAYIDNVVISGCTTPPPPTISKSFGTDPVSVGSNSTLTFTISNTTSGNSALTGVNFTDVLPGGLLIASTPNLTNTCGGTATAAANTSSISLASGTLSAGATCTISVSVRGVTAGSYTNTSTNISSTETGANTSTTPNVGFAQDTIVVISPPVIQKSFTANPIFTGATTTLNFSINNPNIATTLTGISFTDTLPAGLDVTNGSTAQCNGGTLTLTNNSPAADTVVLTGGSLTAGATCTFSVTVTGTTTGLKTNTVTVSSTNGGTGNTDTAEVVVRAQTPAISTLKSVSTSNLGPWSPSLTVTLPGSVYYRFIVENIGDVALNNVNISDLNVNTSTCTWINGNSATISAGGANFTLPVANALDEQIATCIIGPITALGGTNPNTVTADDNNTPGGTGTPNTSDTSTATYTGIAPNLTISKTDSDADNTVLPTESFDWTITVTNNGNATANFANAQVILSDALPGLDSYYTLNTINETNGATPPTGTIDCAIVAGPILSCVANGPVTLPAGASFSLTFTVTPTVAGTLANTAIVDPNNVVSESNETVADNQSTNTITVLAPPSISKSFSPDPINVGGISTLTFTINNPNTNTALNGVAFTDSLPAGLQVAATPNASTSVGCGSPTFAPAAGITSLTFSGGTIAASGSCTVSVDITATTAGLKTNTSGNVSSTNAGTGNTATDTLQVNDLIDVSLTKDVNDDTPNVSDVVTFTLTLANAGPSTATNVEVQDAIPSGYLYVAASIDSNAGTTGATITETEGSGVLIWDVDALDSGESVTLTYQATVLASGFYDNYVQVTTHDQTDSDSTFNNSQQTPDEDDDDIQTVTPNPVADLSITKTDSVTNVTTGGSTTYTIVVTNAGPSSADNAIFTDPSATGLNATSVTCGSESGGAICPAVVDTTVTLMQGTGIIIPTLPSGGSVTFTVIANVTANSGTVTNVANINPPSGTTDTNLTNNSASDTDTVDPILAPALNITKDGTLDMTVVSPNGQANAGDVINYSISVQNTGNTDLTGVVVTDTLLSNLDCDGTAGIPYVTTGFTITVGNTLTCTGSYTLTQTDLDNNGGGDGDIDNTATADSNETGPDTDPNEETFTQSPSLNIVKEVSTAATGPWNDTSVNVTVGDTVYYRIRVQNTGNITLTNLLIGDSMCTTFRGTDITGDNDNIFEVGEEWVYICSVTAVAGSHDNTAIAISDQTPQDLDDANYVASTSPSLNIVKEVSTAATGPWNDTSVNVTVGDTVYYRIRVENTGNITLTNLLIGDSMCTTFRGTDITGDNDNIFEVGEEWVYICSVTAVAGTNNNTATAITDQTPLDSDNASYFGDNPSLNIVKEVSTDNSTWIDTTVTVDVGDTVYYQIRVENTGNITLTNLVVDDGMAGCTLLRGTDITGNNDNVFEVGEEWVYTCSVTALAGTNNNTATADSTETPQDSDNANYFGNNPSLNVVKEVSIDNSTWNDTSVTVTVGDTVYYRVRVSNTGNITLTNIVVDDGMTGCTLTRGTDLTGDNDNVFEVGEEWVYTCSITAVVGTNNNTATADSNETPQDSDNASYTANVIPAPALNITKSGTLDMDVVLPTGQANASDVINYSISVQNTGNQDLTGVSVSDPLLSNLDCDSVAGVPLVTTGLSITIGNTLTCSGSYTLTQNDLDTNGGGDGDIDNTATVDSNETGPDTDSEEVVIPLVPAIQVDKTLVGTTFNNPNELRITYTIDVQNTGNVALTNLQVTDDLVAAFPGSVSFSVFTHYTSGATTLTVNAAFDGDTDQNLLVGTDTLPVGASGQITLIVDVDTGGDEDTYVNTAVGIGTPLTGPDVTDEGSTGTPSFVDPAVAKVANPNQASVGEVVTFTITVTNNGNLPAPDVVVVDPLPAMFDVTNVTVTGGPAGTLTTVSPPIGGTAPFTVTVEIGGPPGVGNNPLGVTDVVVIQITTVVNSLGNPPITNSATLTTTAQTDNLFNNAATVPLTILSPADGGAVPELPATGFAPNIITDLPVQPDDLAYSATDVILEIPSLGLKMPIVGVPLTKKGWDVTWLGKQAGWLEGSAFPSWNGNSVLTGHVTLSNGLAGPFAKLNTLKYGDQIIVHANGQKYIFELRTNTTVTPDNKRYFKHEELPWLTLITCKEYDEKTDTYKKRVLVTAVLVEVK